MKTVQVYNLETRGISTIPASELAPGMVEADVLGVGRVWISASQAREFAGFRHGPLRAELRDAIRAIKETLDDVYPMSLEDWENGFRKDSNPEQEIGVWLHIRSVYEKFAVAASPEKRRDVLRVLVACSMSPREKVFEILQLGKMTRENAEQIVEAFYTPDQN